MLAVRLQPWLMPLCGLFFVCSPSLSWQKNLLQLPLHRRRHRQVLLRPVVRNQHRQRRRRRQGFFRRVVRSRGLKVRRHRAGFLKPL